MRPRIVFRTSREVRDEEKLNQLLVVLPLLEDGETGIDGELMEGAEFAENDDEPVE